MINGCGENKKGWGETQPTVLSRNEKVQRELVKLGRDKH